MHVTITHHLPGRLRLDVPSFKRRPLQCLGLESALQLVPGVVDVRCHPGTGRALIRYAEGAVSQATLVAHVTSYVEAKLRDAVDDRTLVAATTATVERSREAEPLSASNEASNRSPERTGESIPTSARTQIAQWTANPYGLPAIASAGLLATLSLKRLLVGRSALGLATGPFLVAAGLSVAAGYPVLRRGMERTLKTKRTNPDLILGLATLSMAALRENLVALSAVTLLNVMMYRRHQDLQLPEATRLAPEVELHTKRMTRESLLGAPLTYLFTRNPMKTLGVVLASNPRPILLAHKHAWAEAESRAVREQHPVPRRGNLETLAAARTLVFTNGAALSGPSGEWQIKRVQEGFEESKALTFATSLLSKQSEHPLAGVLQHASQADHGTMRTPFHVEVDGETVRGTINGHDTLLATKEYVKLLGIDLTPILMEERRLRRDGFKPYLLVLDGEIVALFGSKQQLPTAWQEACDDWEQRGYAVYCLQQEERIPCPLQPITIAKLQDLLQDGQAVCVVGDGDLNLDSPHLVHLPSCEIHDLQRVLAHCEETNERVLKDLKLVRVWNGVGPGLALWAPFTAPLINLLGDLVGLFLIARQRWAQHQLEPAAVQPDGRTALQNRANDSQESSSGGFHAFEAAAALEQLGSRSDGLRPAEWSALRERHGRNALPSSPPPSPLRLYFGQFKDFATLILLGASAVSFLMGERFNAACMSGILIVNAFIGTWQELRSSSVLQALKNEGPQFTKVLRDGTEQALPVEELVPGDIVMLEAGDRVPADLRLLESWNVEANEAMLTGESLPVAKSVAAVAAAAPLAERRNMLFMGTVVTRGRARAVVTEIGAATQIGAVQSLLLGAEEPPTPLQQRVTEIGKKFVYGALAAGAIVAIAGYLRGIPPYELLMSTITLAASAIPEGLPLTITIALTAGVMRMAKKKAVVRKLSSLESLGRVTVICSDKTGTLTRNEMTVKEITTLNDRLYVTGDGYGPDGAFQRLADQSAVAVDPDLTLLLRIGLLCNNSSLQEVDGRYAVMGDPTEAALLTVGQKGQLSAHGWTRHREIPFDSNTGSMSVVCQEELDGTAKDCLLLTKGSPEAILKKCTHYRQHGQILELTDAIRQQIVDQNIEMAERALRVLGFAYRPLDEAETPATVSEDRLIYVGLMGMIDPPKDDVATSIQEARRLGIKPVMITGDHPVTARAIGRQLGIYLEGDTILTGDELERMNATELAQAVRTTSVFARVSPEHKLRIVDAFQSNGEVVAMTGDGVNDAPAVRKADVGIAMGVQGTDVTKDTAGIILMEDHFHSIVDGVKEGRSIIGNIRKAIGCLLTGNLAEVLVTAAAVIVGLPMPLVPLQILLMNLMTDAIPAMVLATDKSNSCSTSRHQDCVDGPLYKTVITRGVVLGLGALGVFAWSVSRGVPLGAAQTMTFATLVAGQLIQTVAWRRYETDHHQPLRSDRPLFLAMGASWLALAATIYVPGLQGIFLTAPLSLGQWGTVLAVSGSVTTLSNVILRPKQQQPQVVAPAVLAA